MEKLCPFCIWKGATIQRLISHVEEKHRDQFDHPGIELKCICGFTYRSGGDFISCLRGHLTPIGFPSDDEDEALVKGKIFFLLHTPLK